MPANKSAAIRYRIIDNCLTNTRQRFPGLEALARACSGFLGREVSTSTIEKDLRTMKQPKPEGFDAPIIYSKINRGYAYGEMGYSISELNLRDEEWDALRYAALLLFQYKEVPIFSNFKQAIERINITFNLQLDPEDAGNAKHIQFETAVSNSGYQWIGDIYTALRQKFMVDITYCNIYKNQKKSYRLLPYLLKEHRNRWYMTGWVEERKDYLSFALDRIETLSTIQVKQKTRSDFDPGLFLQHSTGIMEGDGRPTKVRLLLLPPFDKLVALEPLHSSQIITETAPAGITLELEVNVNPEFCQRLLAMGAACRVLAPSELATDIKRQLLQSLALYQ